MSSPSNNSANLQLTTTSPTIIVNTENDDMRLNEHQLQIETQDRPTGVRRFRHFKNPPQPHMCIKDHTIDGQEIYINVMSWIRILMPDQLSDPIPLYGGMRVPAPASNIRSAQFVYAVMANPNILKHVKRNCADAEEKHALVELMCDFVEAMNPGLKLKRQPEVLKDRDLTGELKDVWGAVQAKREREKDGTCNVNEPMSFENSTIYKQYYQLQQPEQPQQHHNKEADILMNITTNTNNNDTKSAINNIVNNYDSIISLNKNLNSNDVIDNVNNEPSLIPSSKITENNSVLDKNTNISMNNSNESEEVLQNQMTDNNIKVTLETLTETPQTITTSIVTIPPSKIPITTSKLLLITPTTAVSTPTTSKIITTTTHSSPSTTKKEKLGGFLPNGCHNIFPFIKSKSSNNSDNKEKQEKIQQKDKRSNSLKKSNKNNFHITDKSISVTVTAVMTTLTTTSAAASSTACVETLTPTSSCAVSYSDNISNNRNNNNNINSNNNNSNGKDYNNSNNNNNNKNNNSDIVNNLENEMSKISLNKLVDSNLILKNETFIDKNCH